MATEKRWASEMVVYTMFAFQNSRQPTKVRAYLTYPLKAYNTRIAHKSNQKKNAQRFQTKHFWRKCRKAN